MNELTGTAIGHWFSDRHVGDFCRVQGVDGFDYIKADDGSYVYVWVDAFLDQDMQWHALLEVRTGTGKGLQETRDHLWVTDGALGFAYAWRNAPIAFTATTDEHRASHVAALHWLADQLDLWWEHVDQRDNQPEKETP